MVEITHKYSLTSEWHEELTEKLIKLGGEVVNRNLVMMPKKIADGSFYYTEVIQGLSVIIWDLTYKEPILVKRLKTDDELYIIHYDFSDEMNLIHVDGVKHKIGYKANLGLGVFDNGTDNVFQPMVGERVFAMRLLVAKDLLKASISKDFVKDSNKNRLKSGRNKLFFYDHIDSESKILLHVIKSKTFLDPGFDIYIRGISLQLLAKFIDRYNNFVSLPHSISEKELEAINITKDYLLDNLFQKFPGVILLADLAEMSISKYTSLFKKIYASTPSSFFWREKMILVDMLLKSGKFNTLSDVMSEFDNIKISYLTSKYYTQFGKNPSENFVEAPW